MAYVQQTWANTSSGGTPISAARLTHIEAGIAAVDAATRPVGTTSGTVAAGDDARIAGGAWTGLTSYHSQVAAGTGSSYYAAASRLGATGTVVDLRGQISFTGSVSSATTLAVLATGQIPAKSVYLSAVKLSGSTYTSVIISVGSTGNLFCPSAGFIIGDSLFLDGARYSLSV